MYISRAALVCVSKVPERGCGSKNGEKPHHKVKRRVKKRCILIGLSRVDSVPFDPVLLSYCSLYSLQYLFYKKEKTTDHCSNAFIYIIIIIIINTCNGRR